MPNANEIGKGQAIKFNGDICMVLETQHRTPGNLRAFVQATLRSMRTGKSFVQRFNSNESLEVVPMSRKKYEFSYKDNSGYHFIDPVTYEDITALAIPVLRHRILLNFHAESERIDTDEILTRLIAHLPPPKES